MKGRTGFALTELLLLVIVVAGVVSLILILAGDHRRLARLGEDIGKLGRIGALTGQYGTDNADRLWTFSWRKGATHSQYPDLHGASTDLYANAFQAIDILRRKAGRTDIAATTWAAPFFYSHLVLADAGYTAIPEPTFVSSADRYRLLWSRDPMGFDAGAYQPAPPSVGTNDGKRWPYSASFFLSTSFFDKSTMLMRLSQAALHNQYNAPTGSVLGGVLQSEVAFPSSMVHLADTNARHFGVIHPFATHDDARLPMLMVDGTARVAAAVHSNPGWLPNSHSSPGPTTFLYAPQVWEPGTVSGEPQELVTGRFRWTRRAWEGRDFNGPEACTGQPGCP